MHPPGQKPDNDCMNFLRSAVDACLKFHDPICFWSVMQMRMCIEKTKHCGDYSAARLRDFSLSAMQFHFVLTDSFHFVVVVFFLFFHFSLLFTDLHITGRVNKQPWWRWDVLLSVRQQSSTVYPWVIPLQDNAPSKSRATLYYTSQPVSCASQRPWGAFKGRVTNDFTL